MPKTEIETILELYEKPVLWAALRAIGDNPNHELRVVRPYVEVGQVQNLDAASLGVSVTEPGAIAPTDRMAHFTSHAGKWRFLKVYDRRIVRDYRTQANLFVALFVRQSLKSLKSLSYALASDESQGEFFEAFQHIIRQLNGVWDILSADYKYGHVEEIPLTNPLLQFDPRYHVVLETWLSAGF